METILTVEELEVLIENYYECKLTRDEENDLRRMLVVADYSSEAIDRCRLAMGLEALMKEKAQAHRGGRRSWLRYASVAVSVAVVAVLTVISFDRIGAPSADDGVEAIVYINGLRVVDEAYARQIAERDRNECMAMMHEVCDAGKSQQMELYRELQEIEKLRKELLLN